MASFFQPGSNDPAIQECGNSTFQVYCNSILNNEERDRAWYQLADLIIGAITLGLPLAFFLFRLGKKTWGLGLRQCVKLRKRRARLEQQRGYTETAPHSFKSSKSFRILSDVEGRSRDGEARDYDLLMLPITITGADDKHDGKTRSSALTVTNMPAKQSLACVDVETLGENALEDVEIPYTADFLADIHVRNNLSGLALRCSKVKRPEQVGKLVERLHREQISVLILCSHDSETLPSISLKHASGIILENPCIMPNGERRDYFQSRQLRAAMARCMKIREETPDFFIGFLELWERRPHPSVVRRAVKLAEHFGAVLEHGPSNQSMELGSSVKDAACTLSGFEYLRRSESTELQKTWLMETRQVWIPDGRPEPGVSKLPVKSLEASIPFTSRLLEHYPLPPALRKILNERPSSYPSPRYLKSAPPRKDFWEISSDGRSISSLGCFPVMASPTIEQYNAVVETQCHLKELGMLDAVKGMDAYRLLEALQKLFEQDGGDDLLCDLIEGIAAHKVRVYKGLDTGFRLPEGDSRFWGVSSHRGDGSSDTTTDIFISQQAPDDASTVMHTWMAHHGVPREIRYAVELRLGECNGTRSEGDPPVSIKTAIDRATPAETLFLIQQTQVAKLNDSFKESIIAYCRSVLVSETSKHSWKHLHAKALLEGSMSIRELLRLRLEEFVNRGATNLPTLTNLMTLHTLVDESVEDALFFGDRDPLNVFTNVLLQAFDPWSSWSRSNYVDINADLFALIFFSVLRKAAFEEVYIEATDRCPLFLSQPDQAAVFSELWMLGSQCEIYFGLFPRDIGEIIYNRYRAFLQDRPPTADDRQENEIMTMYSSSDSSPQADAKNRENDTDLRRKQTTHETMVDFRKHVNDFGAMSIFCLPAIMDVMLLTFVGRGMFMTAYMDPEHLQAAGYALLIALLLTAGVTGWVGSTGNYYLAHYAYDNMVYFHVQRLSGGFVLTLAVAAGGMIGFGIQSSVAVGFVFFAYLIMITTYLNLLGVMATMHQNHSPITSGRSVLWQTMPILFISPILSALINGHDLKIYLPITYAFLLVLLFRYRKLCHEWCAWMEEIPKISDKDVAEWYAKRPKPEEDSSEKAENQNKIAQESLWWAVQAYTARSKDAALSGLMKDEFVILVARGMPYIGWLFRKTYPNGNLPEVFSTSWFTQLGEAKKQQEQLSRGLKEHNSLMLFRQARYDIGQNLGLFLIALMDRWVNITMGARKPHPSIYTDSRARYGICLCILYFCFSVMLLDATLQNYWSFGFTLSKEKLVDYSHAKRVIQDWEGRRRRTILKALTELFGKIAFVFGGTTLLLWLLVESPETTVLYYAYALGYTCVIIFQFNRCFTTNVGTHVTVIFVSAAIGFVAGIVLHALPMTAGWLYTDVLAQNIAAVLAALGTFLWCWKDWSGPLKTEPSSLSTHGEDTVLEQRKLSAEYDNEPPTLPSKFRNIAGTCVKPHDGSFVAQKASQLLRISLEEPNRFSRGASWSAHLIQACINLWEDQSINLIIATRDDFNNAGLRHTFSFSQHKGSAIQLTVGFLGKSELHLPVWQPLLATLVAEAILYHVARTELKLPYAKAIQAEHFLRDTETLSKRIEFELAFEEESRLSRLRRKSNCELMRYLCLDVNVDSEWSSIPSSGREAILNRVIGRDIALTRDCCRWMSGLNIDLQCVDFNCQLSLQVFQKASERSSFMVPYTNDEYTNAEPSEELKPARINGSSTAANRLVLGFRKLSHKLVTFVKWVAVLSGAGSDIERELWYCLRNRYFRTVILRALLCLWNICRTMKDYWVYFMLIRNRPSLVGITRLAQKGARRKMHGRTVIIEVPRKTITGFATKLQDGGMSLKAYEGAYKGEPENKQPIFEALYDNHHRLVNRKDADTVTSTYRYPLDPRKRWPVSKEVVHSDFRTVGFYDHSGRVIHGILTIGATEFAFRYHYRSTPKGNADLLRADFKLVETSYDDALSVFWGVPLPNNIEDYNWVPSDKVRRIVKVIRGKTYVTEIEYQHRRDPVITTYLWERDGAKTAIAKAPKVFAEEVVLLVRPSNLSFDSDDLMIHHSPVHINQMKHYSSNLASRASSLNPMSWLPHWGARVYRPVPSWRIRTELWNHWLKTGTLDATTACWMDELVLREEPLLRDYWRARDSGRLSDARMVLDRDIDQIVSAIEIETDVSELCQLPIKTSDLYAMGLGKDANEVTNRPQDCYNDTHDRVSVIFNDIGCWPEAPGGVSNCRRDLVNGHSTIRNHVLAECANDFGIPRFQIERNVQSLKLLPLWGLDGKNAQHGLIDNLLQSQVDDKVWDTDVQRDIVGVFVPLVKGFVKGARTKRYSRADLIEYTNVMISLSKYFEHKDYSRTWNSKEAGNAWVEAWLMPYDDANITSPSEYFDIERPSLSDFREALAIYLAYFFIFSVKIPDDCPRVFQSTHHGISSLYGMILKYRRGVTFGIWDHAILWRESCLNISPAQCELPIAVQSMLLAGIGLATRLAYFHADVIMPCTSLFNPMWEQEVGTDRGKLGSRNLFSRKIDPIVNGISNMESFTPVDKVRSEKPTVVMLSNVQFIKGIKTAILAADIIVNRYGFRDYQLLVYGAKDRQPSYALEMAKLIVENNLSETVILAGFGKPKEVLKDAWLFMNSSISEGLPLAIGEAALAGVPIVATEVGATALVMTDPKDQDQRYGEVVPPNDPVALARAQLSILGMVGPWAKFTAEANQAPAPTLPDEISPDVVEWLTKRMYDRSEDRRKLGLLSRGVVLHSFHGNRYLREHEQMYWIQWHLAKMREEPSLNAIAATSCKFGVPPALRYTEDAEDDGDDGDDEAENTAARERERSVKMTRWQDFVAEDDVEKRSRKKLTKQRDSATTNLL